MFEKEFFKKLLDDAIAHLPTEKPKNAGKPPWNTHSYLVGFLVGWVIGTGAAFVGQIIANHIF